MLACSNGAQPPNNSFKPNLLRYTNNMAGKACHVVGSATQVGLTQALGFPRNCVVPLALTLVDPELAFTVARSAIEPTLRRIEARMGRAFRVKLHQWTPSASLELGELCAANVSEQPVEALGRLCFRPNHGGDLFIFRAEVLVPADTYPGTGFTGFHVDGSVRHGVSPPSVKIRGECKNYNHEGFSGL